MEEVEILTKDADFYEVVPSTALKKLEERVRKLENTSFIPQINHLISQVVELIKTNQKLVDDMLKANTILRDELERIALKLERMTNTMEEFIEMVKSTSPEELTSLVTKVEIPEMKELVEMQKRIVEMNENISKTLESIEKKLKVGTPISYILSQYPNVKLRSEVKRQ
jgi:methyl-accepting chemotaxis protein